MAKRIIDWTVSEAGVLSLNKYNSDKEAKPETQHLFDLSKIFPDIQKMNAVQKHILVYGMKQQLADAGASEKDLKGKSDAAKVKWDLFVKGEISGPRSNAGIGAENKRILNTVKTATKAVTLEGLMLKKLTFPDQFTKDDQVKLDEFLAVVAKGAGKKTK